VTMPVANPPSATIACFCLPSAIIGHRQRPFGVGSIERYHNDPACRYVAECVLQRNDHKFGDNQSKALFARPMLPPAPALQSKLPGHRRSLNRRGSCKDATTFSAKRGPFTDQPEQFCSAATEDNR
jgi:hypothetical protein